MGGDANNGAPLFEAFGPGAAATARRQDIERKRARIGGMVRLRVRRMEVGDAPAVAAAEERAFADAEDMATFYEGDYRRHVARYPEGQLVAVDEETGAIVGAAVALRLPAEVALRRHHWWDATGGTGFSAHERDGDVLYGAAAFVDPAWQARGVGRALYAARAELLASTDCLALATGGRMPGYGAHAREGMAAAAYVRRVEEGALSDPVLSFQLAQGMFALDVLPRYLTDAQSAHHACLVALPNPTRPGARRRVLEHRALPGAPPVRAARERASA